MKAIDIVLAPVIFVIIVVGLTLALILTMLGRSTEDVRRRFLP